MTRNHRQNDHGRYDNKRRHDDYRPATLSRFWQSFQCGVWGLGWQVRSAFDWILLGFFLLVLIAGVVFSIEVLYPYFKNLIR